MPTHFHGDTDGVLYRKAYFAKFNGIWAHGDFMMVDPHTKGVTMLGRSDATLNPNGVRFGSAEIYQVGKESLTSWTQLNKKLKNNSKGINKLKVTDNWTE